MCIHMTSAQMHNVNVTWQLNAIGQPPLENLNYNKLETRE